MRQANPELDYTTLVGHSRIQDSLRKEGRTAPFPSLIFGGPTGIGKRLCGIWYAAYLNCYHDISSAPCGSCVSCKKVLGGLHPDIQRTVVPDKKTVIGVSEVREAIHEMHYAPFEGRFRVWLIEQGERLTDEAQNALLKTLEEPPPRAIIVLVSSLVGTLIPTIASRCRLHRFQALPLDLVQESLSAQASSQDLAHKLTSLSGGALGSALTLLHDPKKLEESSRILDLFSQLPGRELSEAIAISQTLEKSKTGSHRETLELGFAFFRDLLVLSAGSSELVLHKDRIRIIEDLASKMPIHTIQRILKEFQKAEYFLQRNVSPRLLMQRLCVKLSEAC